MDTDSEAIKTASATLGKQGDVHIPTSLLQHAHWPERESNVPLVAQWVSPGRVRLHLRADVNDDLEARRAQIKDEHSEEMAAFLDTFREEKLYYSKTQGEKYGVKLHAEVTTHLRLQNGNRDVYLEARTGVIDILSPSAREERIAAYLGA